MSDSSKKVNLDELTAEIVSNAQDDRKRLIKCAEGLRKFAERGQVEAEGDGEGMDPEVALALSEQIAKVSDSLTKINQQLVNLVQIHMKTKAPTTDGAKGMSAKEREAAFDDIESEDGLPN